ncbi:hypothetical protein EXIGLDRAFT_717455 [Exidia glandulosa HHB12029]|uniref:N-acetyltransferase domain-containing protein n=1 Tax=Exidia glandulosa HHB12029 TaxID=1314781 RepID=A0A165ICV2_EXIGL|nr:hypothetical protein EXIGLDRAFT_717455 [Exidia glandulosa HHB12029]
MPPKVSTLTAEASTEDRQRAADILQNAFANDVAMLDMAGGDPALANLFYGAWVNAALLEGTVDVVYVDEGSTTQPAFQGVAIWFGPGVEMLGSERQLRAGWNDVSQRFPLELSNWWKNEFPPQLTVCENFTGNVHTSGWYLALLAVDPDHQHKGLGAALLQHGFARVDGDQVPAVLECEPWNKEFYARFGCEVKGSLQVRGPTKTWSSSALRREPRSPIARAL